MKHFIAPSIVGLLAFLPSTQAAPPDRISLQQAIDLAMSHSHVARESAAQAQAARAQVGVVGTDFLPQVSAGVTASAFQQSLNPDFAAPLGTGGLDLSGESYALDVTANYPLLSTARGLNWKQARLEALQADRGHEATRRRLVRDVAWSYLGVVEADALARLAKEDLKRRENTRAETRELVQAGRRPEFEFLRADAEVAAATARLVEAENGTRVARAELSRVVGVRLAQDVGTQMPPQPSVPAGAGDLDNEARRKAAQGRPLARAGEAAAQASELSVKASRRRFLPTVGVFARWNRDLAPQETDLTVESYSYGASLSVPFADQAATLWRTRGAKARARAAAAAQERVLYELEVEVTRADLAWRHAQDDVEARRAALVASRRAFESATERYRLGVATQTERIDAEANLAQAEADESRAQIGLSKSIWNLRYALGEPVGGAR